MILTGARKPKGQEKSLSQCHFVHHKSHIDVGANTGLRGEKPATNGLIYNTACI
jgi:hypothetical protein